MNDIDRLFVISAVFVPILLISLNYAGMRDFYAYSVPLNNLAIEHMYSDNPEIFQKISEKEGSTCFTTPSMNHFCYTKPRIYEKRGISYVVGSDGIYGEMHFDPTDMGVSYFTIKNMTVISKDTAMITFADKNYRIGNGKRTDYEITDKFEFSAVIKKYDTFVTHCGNYEGTGVTVVQYLGVVTIDNVDYFQTWHTQANSDKGVPCKYPQIIQHSIKHNFWEL